MPDKIFTPRQEEDEEENEHWGTGKYLLLKLIKDYTSGNLSQLNFFLVALLYLLFFLTIFQRTISSQTKRLPRHSTPLRNTTNTASSTGRGKMIRSGSISSTTS